MNVASYTVIREGECTADDFGIWEQEFEARHAISAGRAFITLSVSGVPGARGLAVVMVKKASAAPNAYTRIGEILLNYGASAWQVHTVVFPASALARGDDDLPWLNDLRVVVSEDGSGQDDAERFVFRDVICHFSVEV